MDRAGELGTLWSSRCTLKWPFSDVPMIF